MNVLTIFEQRIGAIFLEGAPEERKPFSFRRLAKRAVREMEDETFVIDGVDTAPALYTILVSSRDDEVMRPLYVQITDEISQLIEAQAKKRGYTFVGRPLVRFMVDPALRKGRFSVFAENIDPRTLARLRDEENAYLGIAPAREIVLEQGSAPASAFGREEAVAEEPVAVAADAGERFDDELFGSEFDDEPEFVQEFGSEPLDAGAEQELRRGADLAAEVADEAEEYVPEFSIAAEPVLELDAELALDEVSDDADDDLDEPADANEPVSKQAQELGIEQGFETDLEHKVISDEDFEQLLDDDAQDRFATNEPADAAQESHTSFGAHFGSFEDFLEDDAEVVALNAPEPGPFDEDFDEDFGGEAPAAPAQPEFVPQPVPAAPAPQPAPAVVREPEPVAAPQPVAAPEPEPSCTLTDLATGRVYTITAERTPIGRERATGAVVLTDPNASRRHAELVRTGSTWRIRDLRSTNGTLVNNMDVTEMTLRNGDVLTIGLTDLEFRAG